MSTETTVVEPEVLLTILLQDGAIEFDEWQESQDFEYTRVESEVVDYVNTVVDYDSLNDSIKYAVRHIIQDDDFDTAVTANIQNIDGLIEGMGIELDSTEFDAAKRHLTEYCNARITYYRRLLE